MYFGRISFIIDFISKNTIFFIDAFPIQFYSLYTNLYPHTSCLEQLLITLPGISIQQYVADSLRISVPVYVLGTKLRNNNTICKNYQLLKMEENDLGFCLTGKQVGTK